MSLKRVEYEYWRHPGPFSEHAELKEKELPGVAVETRWKSPYQAAAPRTAVTSSPGIYRIPSLGEFLAVNAVVLRRRGWSHKDNPQLEVGWGNKRPRVGKQNAGVPYYRLEDGFVCYTSHPARDRRPLSLVVDCTGIYYDATTPSELEGLLNSDSTFLEEPLHRARKLIGEILESEISKYNHARNRECLSTLNSARHKVLVVDQVSGDKSITHGLALAQSFDSMLLAALRENPDSEVYVKRHPDVKQKGKNGHYHGTLDDRVLVIEDDVNPIALLKKFDKVYTVTSQLGFEALMLGREVVCFGMPFYAGWGLTNDRVSCNRRKKARNVLEVFTAAYLMYSRYVHPLTGKACELEDIVEYLKIQKEHHCDAYSTIYCLGFSPWKRAVVRPFLQGYGRRVKFVRGAGNLRKKRLEDGAALLTWGYKKEADLGNVTLPILRIEDGFLRSVGLGSDFVRPCSLVIDSGGLYYNLHESSDLERILRETQFSPSLLDRAAELIKRLRRLGIGKYNCERQRAPAIKAGGKPVVLVVGQVDDDESLKRGCLDIRKNEDLIRAVRKEKPEAWLVYKPHPDVLAKNRRAGRIESVLEACDQVIAGVTFSDCISEVDEVHTMTSLAGFEALIHGKKVVTYGVPFYAGWGLTHDRHKVGKRDRRLTLKELVAGALILYPRYLDWGVKAYCTPEHTIDVLVAERNVRSSQDRDVLKAARRRLRKLRCIFQGMYGH